MNLVDRLVDVLQWPISRKTVLIASASVVVPPGGWPVSYLLQPEQPVMHFELLTPFMLAWTLVILANRLLVLPYACFMIALIQFNVTQTSQ